MGADASVAEGARRQVLFGPRSKTSSQGSNNAHFLNWEQEMSECECGGVKAIRQIVTLVTCHVCV